MLFKKIASAIFCLPGYFKAPALKYLGRLKGFLCFSVMSEIGDDHVSEVEADSVETVEDGSRAVEDSHETGEDMVLPAPDNYVNNFSLAMSAPKKDEVNVLETKLDIEDMGEDAFANKYASAEAEAHTARPFNNASDKREVLAKLG